MSAILAAILDFSNFIFGKTAVNFLEINKKQVFTASNRNIIKNIEWKKIQFLFSNFNLQK